ncbi:competence protein ComK [Neobacillus vireti]|uniref:Competence transcription factor n=1 Tax=Neobacillus vireti LMG 21834 TaxID=1131730 RepID=A0AB94INX1_9BACI|nr:competence protein ComK [Neobacillus vireti]ETI68682.1 competence transcription factor [Neobacillus vireti LMG 21834]
MQEKVIEDYEVNSRTMFIVPVKYGSKVYSKIYEVEDVFLCPLSPLEIIKKSCNYFGVDYESRRKGSRNIIGNKRKLPIVIELTNQLIFFPTLSPYSKECIWIASEHVKDYQRIGPQEAIILFYNKQTHRFPVPCSTIEAQMLKTSLLKTELLKRIEHNEKRLNYILSRTKLPQALETTSQYESEFHVKNPK